jgi:hypothetical protein
MARRQKQLWCFEPQRSELAEKLGPPLLRVLALALASIIAIPLLLSLLLPILI